MCVQHDQFFYFRFRAEWLKDKYATKYPTKEEVEKDKNLTDEERQVLLRIHNRALTVVPSVLDLQLLKKAYGNPLFL